MYLFPEKELRGLRPNVHIHVSCVYIPRIGPHIFLQQNSQTDCGNIQIAHRHMNVEIRTEAAHSFSGNMCFELSVMCLCSVY
jgi:hypothetical protein